MELSNSPIRPQSERSAPYLYETLERHNSQVVSPALHAHARASRINSHHRKGTHARGLQAYWLVVQAQIPAHELSDMTTRLDCNGAAFQPPPDRLLYFH